QSDNGLYELSIAEEEKRRDRPHAVARGCHRIVVDIQLGDLHPPLELACEVVYDGSQCSARPTPLRPEIHDRYAAMRPDLRGETLVRNLRYQSFALDFVHHSPPPTPHNRHFYI